MFRLQQKDRTAGSIVQMQLHLLQLAQTARGTPLLVRPQARRQIEAQERQLENIQWENYQNMIILTYLYKISASHNPHHPPTTRQPQRTVPSLISQHIRVYPYQRQSSRGQAPIICRYSQEFWFICLNQSTHRLQQFQSSLLIRNIEFMFEIYNTAEHSEELFNIFQSHKRVCAHHIKIASEKLYIDEAKRILEANQLLEKIALRQRVKDLSQWDVFSTRDSVIFQDQLSINLSIISGESKSRFLSRKGAVTSRQTPRDFEGQMSECLNDVSSMCSVKTYSTIKKLVEDFKKLKSRIFQLQKKQRNVKLRQKSFQEIQQKNLIYSNRLQDFSLTIQKLREENQYLKVELSKSLELLHKKETEINSQKKIKIYEQIINKSNSTPKKHDLSFDKHQNNENLAVLMNLIKEKEHIINLRYEQISTIEANIQKSIFKEYQSCNNCCNILKKIKGSILNYKNYLQRQAQQFQTFFDKYKTSIFNEEE